MTLTFSMVRDCRFHSDIDLPAETRCVLPHSDRQLNPPLPLLHFLSHKSYKYQTTIQDTVKLPLNTSSSVAVSLTSLYYYVVDSEHKTNKNLITIGHICYFVLTLGRELIQPVCSLIQSVQPNISLPGVSHQEQNNWSS